ncbi:cytochrome P450 [Ascobolus immersus RN42]|uniref:Cytochrome P450 n=1 Tax=Ascobolus immersus RN42 TaxID=1160509 RepID=A0A3N4IL54_ASCIM|nr:cytochrome P450 [Ascobolus immersus RN42]
MLADLKSELLNLRTIHAVLEVYHIIRTHWALVLVGILIFRYIRRLYFHPLSAFPGPFLARISNVYSMAIYFSWREHEIHMELHKKYGPVVRLSPDALIISDPKYLPIVYHMRVNKPDMSETQGANESVLGAAHYKEHAKRKRRVAGAYSMTNVRRMEHHVDGHVIRLIKTFDDLYAKTGKVFDYAPWAQYFAYDVVSDVAFGKPLGFVETNSDVFGLLKMFQQGIPITAVFTKLPTLAWFFRVTGLKGLLKPKPNQNFGIGGLMHFKDKLLAERYEEFKKGNGGRNDFLKFFFESKNEDGSPMSLNQVGAEALVIMFAGSDTTSAALREMINFLHLNPRCYKKVVDEIDAAYAEGRMTTPVPNFDELSQLTYVNAVFKETLRLAAAVPVAIQRIVDMPGFEIDGKFVPGGTLVGINSYVCARQKSLYGEDAEEFRPERWLEDEEKRKELERYDHSFGYGSRPCLGKNLATMEILKVLCTLFHLFEVKEADAPEGCTYKREKKNIGLMLQRGIWLKLVRKNVEAWKAMDQAVVA